MPDPSTLTHADLVEIGVHWLKRRGCVGILTELGGRKSVHGEIPDVIGWHGTTSILLECKVSRADFFADRKKPFRQDPSKGMGAFRYYLVPSGLLDGEDLAQTGWGLLETAGKLVRLKFKGKQHLDYCVRGELQLMATALQRVQFRITEPLHKVVGWQAIGTTVAVGPEPDDTEKLLLL